MSNLQVEQSQPVTKEFSIKAILPVILALITGMLLVMLDSTIMNVAIPQLEKTFDASLKTIQWAITGYTLALSVIIPLAGWFSDKFTAKRVFSFDRIVYHRFFIMLNGTIHNRADNLSYFAGIRRRDDCSNWYGYVIQNRTSR